MSYYEYNSYDKENIMDKEYTAKLNKICNLMTKRKWDYKDTSRASGVNLRTLESILNGDRILEPKQLDQMYEIIRDSKKSNLLKFEKPIVMTFYAYKGGIGKSSLAYNLAYSLAQMGYKILVIDADGQADTSSMLYSKFLSLGNKNLFEAMYHSHDLVKGGYVFSTDYDNLDVVVANMKMELMEATVALKTEPQRKQILELCFKTIIEENYYDMVIIDRDKNAGLVSGLFLEKTDFIIMPVLSQMLSVKSAPNTRSFIEACKERNSKLQILGMVWNLVDKRKNPRNTSAKDFYDGFDNLLFNTIIPVSADFESSQDYMMPLGVYKSNGEANKKIQEFTIEVLERIEKSLKERGDGLLV